MGNIFAANKVDNLKAVLQATKDLVIPILHIGKEREVDQELENQKLRFKPDSLADLEERTNFTRKELQLLYRGFKENCPNGMVTLEKFKDIFAHFFSLGDSGTYAELVFTTFDEDGNGSISFEEFAQALSVLLRGSEEEKLEWIFDLYDCRKRGYIVKQDMLRVVKAIYDLMGRSVRPPLGPNDIMNHTQDVFAKLDKDGDGKITLEEFLEGCQRDSSIRDSLDHFTTIWV